MFRPSQLRTPRGARERRPALLGCLDSDATSRHGRIISDPEGAIAAARSKILLDWAKPRWRTHRTERAITFARSALEGLDEREEGAEGLAQICDLVMQLAGLVAIAHGVTPTHRRALALAHSILDPRGRSDLVHRMLGAIGADDADNAFVSECTDDAIAAVRVAARYDDPTMEWSDELPDALAAAVAAGIGQLVAEGYVREAVLPALDCCAASSTTPRGSAEPSLKREFRVGVFCQSTSADRRLVLHSDVRRSGRTKVSRACP